MTRVPVSVFAQHYRKHLEAASLHDDVLVLEQRSGAPSWVLESARRHDAKETATTFLVSAVQGSDEAVVTQLVERGLATVAPWVTFLPAADRQAFEAEAVETLHACAALGSFVAFGTLLEEWRATAEVHADPALAALAGTPVPDPVDLPVE